MSDFSLTEGERLLQRFALKLREVADEEVPIPRHILALAKCDPDEYGRAAYVWQTAMSGSSAAPAPPAPAPAGLPAGRTIGVCMNCYVGHENPEGEGKPVVNHLCATCGLHDHVILRIVARPRPGGPRIQPIAKVNMDEVTRGERARGPRGPTGPEGQINARSAVRAGSAAADVLGDDFWERSLTDGEERYYDLFEGRPDPQRQAPLIEVAGEKYMARFRIGNAELPLLRAYQPFADVLNGVPGPRPSHLDSFRHIRLRGPIGQGSYGTVYSVSPAKSDERAYAMKVAVVIARKTVTDPSCRHPIIDVDPNDLHAEYVMGAALRLINDSRPAGTAELALVLPLCIFGIALSGGRKSSKGRAGGSEAGGEVGEVPVAICIVMPLLAMNVQVAAHRINIRDGRVAFLRNLLRTIAATLRELHAAEFTHADIKTENILIQNTPVSDAYLPEEGASAKLCDYSLSTFGRGVYVCMSPDYRAPEIWLGLTWGPAIDIWGLGCVAMEVFLKDRLHVDAEPKCETMKDYVGRIAECFGPYTREMYAGIKDTIEAPAAEIRAAVAAPVRVRRSLAGFLEPRNEAERSLADLIGKMLTVDPEARCTASDMLAHPFLAGSARSSAGTEPRPRRE